MSSRWVSFTLRSNPNSELQGVSCSHYVRTYVERSIAIDQQNASWFVISISNILITLPSGGKPVSEQMLWIHNADFFHQIAHGYPLWI